MGYCADIRLATRTLCRPRFRGADGAPHRITYRHRCQLPAGPDPFQEAAFCGGRSSPVEQLEFLEACLQEIEGEESKEES